ncbi:MAG: hypothetical protein HOP15_18345 [Planctomycetes bacterium]|nr:hypothetical protein [Planctomycetota bacterium]
MGIAALLLVAPLLLQESCPNCLHRGVLPCKAHVELPAAEEEPGPENPVLYCSWAASCAACEGTLWIDCPRCARGERTKEVEERRSVIKAWMESNALERELDRPVPRLETNRFRLVIDVKELPEGKKKLSGHALAHRLAHDLEHVTALVAEHYQMNAQDYRSKMRMWLWSTLATHQKAQEKFQGTITSGDFKLLGRDPVFSVWTEPTNFDTVSKVRENFAHNAGHMLLSNAFQPNWVGDIGGGWLDAGLGHWYEYELFAHTVNYCLEESALLENYENGQWRAAVRRRLEREKDPFLPGLLPKRSGALSAAEDALCWSFYDWLLTQPGVLRKLMIDIKQKMPAREVLAQHLGMDLFATEDAWRAWVAVNYPLKGDEPRAPKGDKKDKQK